MKLSKDKIRIILYSIAFLFLMIIDERNYMAPALRSAYVQASAFPFFLIIFMQMKMEKIKNVVCVSYLGASTVIILVTARWICYNRGSTTLIILIEILMLGFTIIYAIRERETYFKGRKISKLALAWVILFVFMILSKDNSNWVWEFMVMFILLIIYQPDVKEQELILNGMIYGFIASYFLIQGSAFVFRPYDRIRYHGFYNNPNLNALFYVVVLAAFLSNQYRLKKKNSKKLYQVLNFIFAMSVIAFSVLTMSKSALLTELVLSLLYLGLLVIESEKKIKTIVLSVVTYLIGIIVLLPICYCVARYTPPLFHHPVFGGGESSVNRVQSTDPYDSEKYPDHGKIVDRILNRFLGLDIIHNDKIVVNEKTEKESNAILGDGRDAMHPLYVPPDEPLGTYTARVAIWKEYIGNRLNLTGHEVSKPNFWLTEGFCIGHAHNVFIEFSYRFGIPVGVIFFLVYFGTAIYQLVLVYREKSGLQFTILLMLIIMAVFGMVEMSWSIGQIPLVMFYFMTCNVIWSIRSDSFER